MALPLCFCLSDSLRSGASPTFTPEQVAAIIALSCEEPSQIGLPFSYWASLLRDVAIGKGIVTSISERQIQRFFKRSRPTAYRCLCWLNLNIENYDSFQEQVASVNDFCEYTIHLSLKQPISRLFLISTVHYSSLKVI